MRGGERWGGGWRLQEDIESGWEYEGREEEEEEEREREMGRGWKVAWRYKMGLKIYSESGSQREWDREMWKVTKRHRKWYRLRSKGGERQREREMGRRLKVTWPHRNGWEYKVREAERKRDREFKRGFVCVSHFATTFFHLQLFDLCFCCPLSVVRWTVEPALGRVSSKLHLISSPCLPTTQIIFIH